MMVEIRLAAEDWQRVLALLAQGPWATANPLIMAIGDQLRMASAMAATPPAGAHIPVDGRGRPIEKPQ